MTQKKINPAIVAGSQVRRMLPIPAAMQGWGVSQGGVYTVLEVRHGPTNEKEYILGPLWPEEHDIRGRWSAEGFAKEGLHLDYVAPGGALAADVGDPMAEAPAPVQRTATGRKKRSDAGKPRKPRVGKDAVKVAPKSEAVDVAEKNRQAAMWPKPEAAPVPAPPLPQKPVQQQANPANPLAEQIGGDHYKKYPKGYQPLEIAVHTSMDPLQFNMLKYLMRFKDKGGAQDLDKLIHMAQTTKALLYPGQ